MDHLALDHHMLQDDEEFTAFCELLVKEKVQSYLEIGSWSGGSIEMVAKYLPKGSRIVSVELPVNPIKYERLQDVLLRLFQNGYATFLVTGNSADATSIISAKQLGPYDAVFIDGGHTFECVQNDWENYGKLGRRIVGFHDIAIDSQGHGVCRFWNQLKTQYRHVEFISEETRRQDLGYGIGVVFRDNPSG